MSDNLFELGFDDKEVQRKLTALLLRSPAAYEEAAAIAGLEFLNWVSNGSPRESRKPPIRRGFLRGSGSVFVGGKLIGVAEGDNREVNRSHTAPKGEITWGFNAAHATRMHEGTYKPGPFSTQDGNSGNKYLEMHLEADRDEFMELLAHEFGKGLGTL